MHNHDDKYPTRPGFEPGTSRLQAPVDTNEPSGPAERAGDDKMRTDVKIDVRFLDFHYMQNRSAPRWCVLEMRIRRL